MPAFIPGSDIEAVFDEWKATRTTPAACKLTDERRDLITARLRLGYTADEIRRVIRYIARADTPDARWMRGANPRRREYLDLTHILRKQRLGERVEASATWEADTGGRDQTERVDRDPWVVVMPGQK